MHRSLFILVISALSAFAGSITTTVDGTAMPWNWVAGGLNDGFQFGIQDGTAPTVVSSGINLTAGSMLTFTTTGLTSAFGGFAPYSDAVGDTFYATRYFDGSNVLDSGGSSGTFFPSKFVMPYPLYLNALVGAFTDASGGLIAIFFPGVGPSTFVVPVGTAQIQLGLNDDIFVDNSGSFRVTISDVPEPATFALLAAGLALGLAFRRR